jgi:hypothetical protein
MRSHTATTPQGGTKVEKTKTKAYRKAVRGILHQGRERIAQEAAAAMRSLGDGFNKHALVTPPADRDASAEPPAKKTASAATDGKEAVASAPAKAATTSTGQDEPGLAPEAEAAKATSREDESRTAALQNLAAKQAANQPTPPTQVSAVGQPLTGPLRGGQPAFQAGNNGRGRGSSVWGNPNGGRGGRGGMGRGR